MADLYFDNNATTAVLPEVRERMCAVLDMGPLNPSSSHRVGAKARGLLEEARREAAGLVSCDPACLSFTSGATEANHRVLTALAYGPLRGHALVTTAVEHASVLEAAELLWSAGHPVTILPVDGDGLVSLERLEDAIATPRTLVSIQWANNETGVIQPMKAISEVVQGKGALLHCDATQAVGKLMVDLSVVPIDFLVFSSHKLNGPQGAGALVATNPNLVRSHLPGGGQESGVRPGTQNLVAAAGFGRACSLRAAILDGWIAAVGNLRDTLEAHLALAGIAHTVNGVGAERLCNTSNIRLHDVDGEALSVRLQSAGLACSQGSACHSMRPEPSRVLRAMGLSEAAAWASLRFSLSAANTELEVREAGTLIESVYSSLRAANVPQAV